MNLHSGHSICNALPTAADQETSGYNATAALSTPPQVNFINAGGRPINAYNTGGGSGAVTSAGTNGGLGRSSYEGGTVPTINPDSIDSIGGKL
jgi:hypothetical protein